MEVAEYTAMDLVESKHWWFVAKRLFVSDMLKRFAPGVSGRALDVGCGTGAVLQLFKSNGFEAVGVDPSPEALEYCKQKGAREVVLGSATHLPFPDNTFSVVTALDVLEHISEDTLAVQEITRVLKPGGIFIATVPAHQFLFSYHDTALHHVRRYSKSQLRQLLAGSQDVLLVSWFHATILLPAIIRRVLLRNMGHANGGSDVQPASGVINAIMSIVYAVERLCFKIFGRLPFGLSLISVSKKK